MEQFANAFEEVDEEMDDQADRPVVPHGTSDEMDHECALRDLVSWRGGREVRLRKALALPDKKCENPW